MKILKPPDWKVWDHLEISHQFWNRLDNFVTIWKYPTSCATVWKVFKSSGKIPTVLKPFGKFWDHLEISEQFWNRLLSHNQNIYKAVQTTFNLYRYFNRILAYAQKLSECTKTSCYRGFWATASSHLATLPPCHLAIFPCLIAHSDAGAGGS